MAHRANEQLRRSDIFVATAAQRSSSLSSSGGEGWGEEAVSFVLHQFMGRRPFLAIVLGSLEAA
jgi:hypothetical protein